VNEDRFCIPLAAWRFEVKKNYTIQDLLAAMIVGYWVGVVMMAFFVG
jgi:hypothetical protein